MIRIADFPTTDFDEYFAAMMAASQAELNSFTDTVNAFKTSDITFPEKRDAYVALRQARTNSPKLNRLVGRTVADSKMEIWQRNAAVKVTKALNSNISPVVNDELYEALALGDPWLRLIVDEEMGVTDIEFDEKLTILLEGFDGQFSGVRNPDTYTIEDKVNVFDIKLHDAVYNYSRGAIVDCVVEWFYTMRGASIIEDVRMRVVFDFLALIDVYFHPPF